MDFCDGVVCVDGEVKLGIKAQAKDGSVGSGGDGGVVDVVVQKLVAILRDPALEFSYGFGWVNLEVAGVNTCVNLVKIWEKVFDGCVGVGVKGGYCDIACIGNRGD